MDLANAVKEFYFAHIDQLPATKQFHFASRLAAWQGEPRASSLLHSLKSSIVPADVAINSLVAYLQVLAEQQPSSTTNAMTARAPYFARYPRLRQLNTVLFRVRHLATMYGVDAKEALARIVPFTELVHLQQQLLSDSEAVAVLSTYAINYCYLVERIVHDDPSYSNIPVDVLCELSHQYDEGNRVHLQLLIYLFTHCIINATDFYLQQPPTAQLSAYTAMLQTIDKLIADNYRLINLDNKLEFLVCCRICNYPTSLFERIYTECQQSLSSEGTFLVDRHNQHPQLSKTSFAESEHRNVLFIMSTTSFVPHSIKLVK